jgi:hypothetical protein
MAAIEARDDLDKIRFGLSGTDPDEPEPPGGGSPAFVGQVTTPTSKIQVGDFLLVQPLAILGPETEGGPGGIYPADSARVPVLLLGPSLAATGDNLVCRFVDNRWVAERFSVTTPGGSIGTIPYCFCSPMPASLTMTSADESCNGGMFQSCSIQYGPTPEVFLPLGLAANTYMSTESFPDPIEGGARFYYLLLCLYDHFELTRVYPSSPFSVPPGNPARDGVLYSWNIGGYLNTCSPFHLDFGTPFLGSDASCFVTIDQES